MRDQLTDMTRQLSPLFKKAKVTATSDSTMIEAHDDDKIVFVVATLKKPIAEFDGEFGIGSLTTLGQLLAVPSYKHEDAKLLVHVNQDAGFISEFEFRDGKTRSHTKFKTMNPRLVTSAKIGDIPWHVAVTPSKSNIAEFTHLAGILSEYQTFGVMVEDKTLYATIGSGASGTHSSRIAFATDVEGAFSAPSQTWNTRHLLAILKNAPGTAPCEVRFSQHGLAGITVDTEHGTYNYILRAKPI